MKTRQPSVAGLGKGADPKWWTLVAVSLGTFMLLLDLTVVNVALPQIQSSLHSSFTGLQWVVDAYALTLAACCSPAGRWPTATAANGCGWWD
jgi:MFS family permease